MDIVAGADRRRASRWARQHTAGCTAGLRCGSAASTRPEERELAVTTQAATTGAGPLAGLLDAARDVVWDDLDAPVLVGPSPTHPLLLSLLSERAGPLLVVVARTDQAEKLTDELVAFLGEGRAALFPAWETLPHERLSPQPATVGQRLSVLDRLARPEAYPTRLAAVVTPVRAVLQPMDPKLAERAPLEVDRRYGGGFDRLLDALVELGYERSPQVEARGEFAVRGGIVDVFPAAATHAVRIEFWGDDVESMREFAVADQRSTGDVDAVTIDPAREIVVDDEIRERAQRLAERTPGISEHLRMLADGLLFEGVESLATMIRPRAALLPEFLPPRAGTAPGVVVVDPILVRERAGKLREEAEVLKDVAWGPPDGGETDTLAAGFADLDLVLGRAPGPTWELTPFATGRPARDVATPLPDAEAWESLQGDVDALARLARRLLQDRHRVIVSAPRHGSAQRLGEVLRDAGIPVEMEEAVGADAIGARVEVVAGGLYEGFSVPSLGLAVLGEFDVFGRRRARRASRRLGTRKAAEDIALDLQPGDYIVHRTHGVGRYVGMSTREVATPSGMAAARDYVVLEYAKGDRLYVPSDQVDAITRYVGADQPGVMRLGGAEWERAKRRVRGEVREIAAELIRLYTARMHTEGMPFSPDGAWQRELEDDFEHEETPDQVAVIDEIKTDMEAPLPMDRLLCGDVGFGKTEVAVRAAAKAVFDGTQAAVLVPTTILAQQHVETFRERFAGFPVEIAMLSRFVTAKRRREILDRLAAGTVDLVIGTHALLGKNVSFKNLGLVIVDEEQRFGVTHKERLKQLRTSVDVLTLSATPIPRTLEMAVSGIRDMSVIETPPEDRQPIHTVVGPYDEAQVALAIRRELLRDGQVFYVHNQVDTIHGAAAHLRELVPDARVEIAHGQMPEADLERVMVRFWEREFDVLFCTTIIESGLDIPNANTLIVERADLLGLAQLHQLRGRIGRSTERGYAYLLFPPDAAMTEGAYERLQTIGEHTRLGSGLSIALRDLEIRGAGNVVGAEQSGHVAAVGFDTYTEMLKEEVADMTGRPIEQPVEIKLELPVDAHLPADYVADERIRLDLYRKIASIRDADAVKEVRAELADRFGPLPPPAERLVNVAALKAALERWGLREVVLLPNRLLRAGPVRLTDAQQVRLERLHRDARYRPTAEVLEVPLPDGVDDLVAWVAKTLRDIFSPPKRRA